jgi:ADP-heptose:LPS heptosyltransferase
LLDNTNFSVVLIGAPVERDALQNLVAQVSSQNCRIYPEQGVAPLLEIASLIEGAYCVFTPDTSIIHFASATKTPVLGFFTPLQMAHEWVPYNVHHLAVYAPKGKPASQIPVEEIKTQVTKFLKAVETLYTKAN